MVEAARHEVERILKAKVVKASAHVRRRSIFASFELAPRGNTSNPIQIAVKLARPDPEIPTFDPPGGDPKDVIAREYAAMSAAARLHAGHADAWAAIGVPKPKLMLDRPAGIVMPFVRGHALRDVLAGSHANRIPHLLHHAEEKAVGIVTLLSHFGDAAIDTVTRDSNAEIAAAERVLMWLGAPAQRQEFDGNTAGFAARLATVVKTYRPASTQLCHGDLKGCNLMLEGSGRLFIVDFEDVVRGDPNLDVADVLLSLKIDSSFYPAAAPAADRMATELLRAWKRRRPIDPETLEFPLFLQAAYHTGRHLNAVLRQPHGGDSSRRRIAACIPWLTGQRETRAWLDGIFAAAETVTH